VVHAVAVMMKGRERSIESRGRRLGRRVVASEGQVRL
jgi:hypothetical protein